MSKTVIISPYNPVPFVKMNAIIPNEWGYVPFGKGSLADSIKPTQPSAFYQQKWQRGHRVTIQVQRTQIGNSNNWSALVMVAPQGYEIATITDVVYYTLPGNKTDDGEQLYTVQWQFSMDQYSALDNYDEVYFKLSFGYGDSSREDYISPYSISIADKQDYVSWVKCNEDTNKKDVLFEQMFPSFGICIDSLGMELLPAGEYETLDDQNDELSVIYSSSYNTYKWQIGGLQGIPQHLVPVIDTVTRSKYIEIDGMRFTREKGAALERLGQEDGVLKSYTLMLRQADAEQSYTYDRPEVLIFTLPGFPAAYSGFYMTNGAETWGYAVSRALYSESELDDIIDLLNGYATANNKTGEFVKVIDEGKYSLYYVNGENEHYYVNWLNPAPVLSQYFTLEFTVTNAAGACQYRFEQKGFHLTDWGDNFGICDEHVSNLAGLQSTTHTYSSTGTKTIYLFHDDAITDIRLENQTNKVTNIGGDFPVALEILWLVEQDFSGLTELDLSPLQTCRNALKILNLNTSGIAKIKAGWASSYTPKAFALLKTIRVDGNAMSVANVTEFIKEFYLSIGFTYYGLIRITQIPAAVIVDSSTLAAITTLTNPLPTGYGWTIVRDL